MKFLVEVLNRQRKIRVSSNRIASKARKILKILQQSKKLKELEGSRVLTLSIVLLGSRKMKEINHRYRGKNYTTDVLSFPLSEKSKISEELYLGEIIICPEKAKAQSILYGVTLSEELQRLLVHGILHLLGYDHEGNAQEARRMKNLEKKILSKLKS